MPAISITATSEADHSHTANHGRLNAESYWKPATNDTGEWLQVCFPFRMLITGIITQGGGMTGEDEGWVEYLKLQYRTGGSDELQWWSYRDYELDEPTDLASTN